MTAATLTRPATTAGRVTFPGILRSEWTKLRTLRSTWWTAGTAVLVIVGIGLLIAADTASQDVTPDAFEFSSSTLIGMVLAQLILAVLAALTVTGEYGTGMIRSSMTVVPRRLPVLAAKAIVLSGFTAVLMLLTSVVTFVLAQLLSSSQGQVAPSLGEGDVLRVVLGAPLTVVLTGLIALGLGTLIRSTAGAVATAVGLFFVVPIVTLFLPSGVRGFAPYLPTNAGGALTGQAIASTGDDLSAGVGIAVMAAWAVVVLVAAGWRLRRTDV